MVTATIFSLFKTNTKETTKEVARPKAVAAESRHICCGFEQGKYCSSHHYTCLACRCNWTSCSSLLGLHVSWPFGQCAGWVGGRQGPQWCHTNFGTIHPEEPLTVRPSVRPSVRPYIRPSTRPWAGARPLARPPSRPSVRPPVFQTFQNYKIKF